MASTNTSSISSADTNSTKRFTPPQTTLQVCDSNTRSSETTTLNPPSGFSLIYYSQSPESCNQNTSYSPQHLNQTPNQSTVLTISNSPPTRYQNDYNLQQSYPRPKQDTTLSQSTTQVSQFIQYGSNLQKHSIFDSNSKEFVLTQQSSTIPKPPHCNQIYSNSSQQPYQNIPQQGPSLPQISEIQRAMIQSHIKSRESLNEEFPQHQPKQVHHDIPEYKLFPANKLGYANLSPFSENILKERHSDESKREYHNFSQSFYRHKLDKNESDNSQTTNEVYKHLGKFPYHLCRPNADKNLDIFFKKFNLNQTNNKPLYGINQDESIIPVDILNSVLHQSGAWEEDTIKFIDEEYEHYFTTISESHCKWYSISYQLHHNPPKVRHSKLYNNEATKSISRWQPIIVNQIAGEENICDVNNQGL